MSHEMTEIDILEELMDDDPFIRAYPSFKKYVQEWDERGGVDALEAPEQIVFEFYAEKTPIDEALTIWYTYSEDRGNGKIF